MSYRFDMELIGPEKQSMRVSCDGLVDWVPAMEFGRWEALRTGHLPATTGGPPVAIEPAWAKDRGDSLITGLRPVLWAREGRLWSPAQSVPLTYFRAAAKLAAERCVQEGRLKEGDTFTYRVRAYAAAPAESPTLALDVEAIEEPLPLRATPLLEYAQQSPKYAAQVGVDMPVFVPADVIAEAQAICRQNPEVETGGLLIGHLCQDPADGKFFMVGTAQIPAEHTDAAAMRLTFTPETWGAARAALALRRSAELIVGWWHDHPFWCRRCSPEKQAVCPLARTFFSTADCALHRSVFDKGFHVALLLTDSAQGSFRPSLFGWRRGLITPLDFGLLGDASGAGAESLAIVGGDEHVPD